MKNLNELIRRYNSGDISPMELYNSLPLDVQKSVGNILVKAQEEDDKKDSDDKEMRDILFESKEDLDKVTPGTYTGGNAVGNAPAPTPPSRKVSITAPFAGGMSMSMQRSMDPSNEQLKRSIKAQMNSFNSQYGQETVRKSATGSSCTICERLHKSVGNVCESCTSAMSKTSWHTNSHLE